MAISRTIASYFSRQMSGTLALVEGTSMATDCTLPYTNGAVDESEEFVEAFSPCSAVGGTAAGEAMAGFDTMNRFPP